MTHLSGRPLEGLIPRERHGRETKRYLPFRGTFSCLFCSKQIYTFFFFFFPYLSLRVCWEHLCKIQHRWENIVPRSSPTLPAFHVLHFAFAVTTVKVLLSPANKGRLCLVGSVPKRCTFLCYFMQMPHKFSELLPC